MTERGRDPLANAAATDSKTAHAEAACSETDSDAHSEKTGDAEKETSVENTGAAEPDRAQKDGDEPERVQKDNDEPEKAQKDGDEPERAREDEDEPEKAQKDNDEPEKAQKDGYEPERARKDGDEPKSAQKDGDEPERVQIDADESRCAQAALAGRLAVELGGSGMVNTAADARSEKPSEPVAKLAEKMRTVMQTDTSTSNGEGLSQDVGDNARQDTKADAQPSDTEQTRQPKSTEADAQPSNTKDAHQLTDTEADAQPSDTEQTRQPKNTKAGAQLRNMEHAQPPVRRLSADHASKPAPEEDLHFDFQTFLDQMRTKSADPIARYVKSFLHEFCKTDWSAEEQSKLVADFCRFIKTKMAKTEPFASMDERQWNNAQEGMEKLLMNRLHGRTFSPKIPAAHRKDDQEEDVLRDRLLGEKLRLHSWLQGRHLEIDEQVLEKNKAFVDLACAELTKINNYRAPRDKMICILNCSKVVWALIRQAKLEENADAFLPIMVYIIARSQPEYLISNVNYINRFRESTNRGEAAYYLSVAAAAASFMEGLGQSSLTIADSEYAQFIEDAVAKEKDRVKTAPSEEMAHGDAALPSSVLSASAGLLVEQLKSYANKIFEPDGTVTPSREGTPQPAESTEPPEEAAARQASAEAYRAERIHRKEFAQVSGTLQQMFPILDKEVIEDVLQQKGVRIGAAIDACLLLVGEN